MESMEPRKSKIKTKTIDKMNLGNARRKAKELQEWYDTMLSNYNQIVFSYNSLDRHADKEKESHEKEIVEKSERAWNDGYKSRFNDMRHKICLSEEIIDEVSKLLLLVGGEVKQASREFWNSLDSVVRAIETQKGTNIHQSNFNEECISSRNHSLGSYSGH